MNIYASLSMCRKLVSYTCRRHTFYKSAGRFPTKCDYGLNFSRIFCFTCNVQETSFLQKCSSAGNMIPALQPPNTGALSHGLSFLISSGTCFPKVYTIYGASAMRAWSTISRFCLCTSLVPRSIIVLFGLGTRLHVRMRTKLENGVLRNGQQLQCVVNGMTWVNFKF